MSGRSLAVNVLGFVEHPSAGSEPFRVDREGRPYLPVGDGGVVLGVDLGDPIDRLEGDHVAAGVCLVHPDPSARAALTALACIGNPAVVRTGAAAGAAGRVVGKRGEEGRLIVRFPPDVTAALRPGDQVQVRAEGQGVAVPGHAAVTVRNITRAVLDRLPVSVDDGGALRVDVRARVPSELMGNGIGRPSTQWCLDLQLHDPVSAPDPADLRFGDLVAVDDVDARWNIGFRKGWTTVGVVVHGPGPQPGHGPGITVILTGPPGSIAPTPDPRGHTGLMTGMMEEADADHASAQP